MAEDYCPPHLAYPAETGRRQVDIAVRLPAIQGFALLGATSAQYFVQFTFGRNPAEFQQVRPVD